MEIEVDKEKNIFVGQNNAGKSNINKAIDCAFNYSYFPSEYDFYDGKTAAEKCYIDIMLTSNSKDGNFDDDWFMIFGNEIVNNEFGEDSFSIRTVIKQNELSKRFEISRFSILDWNSAEFESQKTLSREVRKCIGSFSLNSDRDIAKELRIKNSNFSRLMKSANYGVSSMDSSSIEEALDSINEMILEKMPTISNIEENLSDVSATIDNVENLKILPIPNKFDDLDKGVEIQVENINSTLPINVYGDGTRSWISILTLSAYIESLKKEMKMEGLPYFAIILLEEPESHLHPQAQNKVISQLDNMEAQIFLTTHSSNIISELNAFQLYRVYNDGDTKLKTKEMELNEKDKLNISNLILPFYSEILFSEIIVLVEGITDKLLITEYLKLKKNKKPFEIGVSIVAVNSKDNLPIFRLFCEIHSIHNIIFADKDAEDSLLKDLNKKKLSLENIIFTNEKEIENDLMLDQFEICKKLFIEENEHPDQYISILKSKKTLEKEILKFLDSNKTSYPYWLSRYINEDFYINSVDSVISLIERK